MTTNRQIVHFDLDTFFVSVERLHDSRLNNRPVLVGGLGDRGVVAACSYEARSFGINSGMSMKLARMLCSEAVVVRGDSSRYMPLSDAVTSILKEKLPLVEKASVDEFYADFTGMDTFYGGYTYAKSIREIVRQQTGLNLSMGYSVNKTVSKIATGEAKPNGHIRVIEPEKKQFLAPLPVARIPMVGPKNAEILRELGVIHINTLQKMPRTVLQTTFGKYGLELWDKGQGIDDRPLIEYHDRKSISLQRTFNQDTIDVAKLRSYLIAMAEGLAFQLRQGNKLTVGLSLSLRYSDFQTYSRQTRFPATNLDVDLISCTLKLFEELYTRRVLVRMLSLKCTKILEGGYQINLLNANYIEKQVNLAKAMDKVRVKYRNSRTVMRASAMDTHSMGVRNPFTGEPVIPPAHRQQ